MNVLEIFYSPHSSAGPFDAAPFEKNKKNLLVLFFEANSIVAFSICTFFRILAYCAGGRETSKSQTHIAFGKRIKKSVPTSSSYMSDLGENVHTSGIYCARMRRSN